MRTLVISLLLASPAIAHADKSFAGSGGSWDCSKDAVIEIAGDGAWTITGACKSITVDGADHQLTIESVAMLNVNGASNVADVDTLGTVNLLGADNKVTWHKALKGAKPVVKGAGVNNSVTKATGTAKKTDDSKKTDDTASDDKPSDGAPGGGIGAKADPKATAIDCKKKPNWSTGDGDGSYRFTGPCKKISVGGGENRLWIQSAETVDLGGGGNKVFAESINLLDIGGSENSVAVGTVGTISVGGADNTVTWKKAKSGDKPTMKGQPQMNKIVQVK